MGLCWPVGLDMLGVLEGRSTGPGRRSKGIQVSDMSQHPVVHVRDGAVCGKAESGVWAFLGVPYEPLRSA